MYIAQTYFSDTISDRADAFVYLVALPGDEIDLPAVLTSMRRLGEEYASSVSLFAPDEHSISRVKSELKQELGSYFGIVRQTPGIIVSPAPIRKMARRSDWIYIDLTAVGRLDSEFLSRLIRSAVSAVIEKKKNADTEGSPLRGILNRLWKSIDFKVGAFGVTIDVKKMMDRKSF